MGKEESAKDSKVQAVSKKEDDSYLSEFDWITIREKMEEGNKPETFFSKTARKFGENPLVPIG